MSCQQYIISIDKFCICLVDDDSRSIPETLQLIQSKLQTLQSNQSEVLVNLSDLSKAVTNLQARLDIVNITVNKEGGEGALENNPFLSRTLVYKHFCTFNVI